MKKNSLVTLVLGTISGMLFALGMCMALLPEWGSFRPGIVFGCVGIVLGLVTVLIRRKMENKAPVKISAKTVLTVIVGIVGALALGVGMCFTMVWGRLALGIVIGLVGIVVMLSLIPLVKGIK